MEPSDNCAICMEVLGEHGVPLTCGHLYHGKCIVPWLEKNGGCPTCRNKPMVAAGNHEVSPEEGRRLYYQLRAIVLALSAEMHASVEMHTSAVRQLSENE